MSETTRPDTVMATNETDLLRNQIARLQELHETPGLRLAAHGAGLPEGFALENASALVITREEVFCILNRLRGALATREDLGW